MGLTDVLLDTDFFLLLLGEIFYMSEYEVKNEFDMRF